METQQKTSMEELLKLLIEKIKSKELFLYNITYKKKYVTCDVLFDYKNFNVIESKCSVIPNTTPYSVKELQKDGWRILIVGTYGNSDKEFTHRFTTWKNGAHRGYGDTIMEEGWSCTPYLNIDNNGDEIVLPKKILKEQFVAPNLKYWK